MAYLDFYGKRLFLLKKKTDQLIIFLNALMKGIQF